MFRLRSSWLCLDDAADEFEHFRTRFLERRADRHGCAEVSLLRFERTDLRADLERVRVVTAAQNTRDPVQVENAFHCLSETRALAVPVTDGHFPVADVETENGSIISEVCGLLDGDEQLPKRFEPAHTLIALQFPLFVIDRSACRPDFRLGVHGVTADAAL